MWSRFLRYLVTRVYLYQARRHEKQLYHRMLQDTHCKWRMK